MPDASERGVEGEIRHWLFPIVRSYSQCTHLGHVIFAKHHHLLWVFIGVATYFATNIFFSFNKKHINPVYLAALRVHYCDQSWLTPVDRRYCQEQKYSHLVT
jgi:hypothetical protein